MIPRYSDHAANERTYLAWIRTAIAIMALGFLIEKFDLFLAYAAHMLQGDPHLGSSRPAEIMGLLLVVLGTIIVIGSTLRFVVTRKQIASENTTAYQGYSDILLGILMAISALAMLVYMARLVF